MIKDWLRLGNFPILNKSGLALKLLQFQYLSFALRKPCKNKDVNFDFLQKSQGEVWINFNVWLRFQLKYIDQKFWAASPVIKGVALVNLDENYQQDLQNLPLEDSKQLENIAYNYSQVYSQITQNQFKNWVTRNYLIINAFSDQQVLPTKDSSRLVEIGPGLGAIISLALNSNSIEIYSLDTFEMQTTFSPVAKRFTTEYEKLNFIAVNDFRVERPFKIPHEDLTVLAFWSFTELKLEERLDYHQVFKSARKIIIGTNEYFEGINNFEYIEKLAKTLGMSCTWKTLEEVFLTSIPAYQNKHRLYLLQGE